MWKQRYKNEYKTSNPNLIITAVCSFPNMYDTLEKNIEYYGVKELQKDPMLLAIKSEFWYHNGNNFIPFYFQDDVPKLEKLQNLQPLGKGFFWCIGYQNPNYNKKKSSYSYPSHKQYREWLQYWLENFHTEHSAITRHLFENAIKTWIYENSEDFSTEMKSRRFNVIENKKFTIESFETKEEYLNYLDEMYKTNWYEFVFKAFK